MAKQISDFIERCAMPNHVSGQTVAQQVGTFTSGVHPSSRKGAHDHRGNGSAVGKSSPRGPVPKEYSSTRTTRTTVT